MNCVLESSRNWFSVLCTETCVAVASNSSSCKESSSARLRVSKFVENFLSSSSSWQRQSRLSLACKWGSARRPTYLRVAVEAPPLLHSSSYIRVRRLVHGCGSTHAGVPPVSPAATFCDDAVLSRHTHSHGGTTQPAHGRKDTCDFSHREKQQPACVQLSGLHQRPRPVGDVCASWVWELVRRGDDA